MSDLALLCGLLSARGRTVTRWMRPSSPASSTASRAGAACGCRAD